MPVNDTINQTAFSAPGPLVEQAGITQLQTAIARLEAAQDNVRNCDCAPSNCCQACQVCQSCQGAACQSQSCQSLRQCSISENCNCNCGCNNGS